MKLLVLDGNSILNRAFYGIRLLTTKDGMYTNGIYGFLTMLEKIKGDSSPDAIAIAFDLKAPTFRHKAYDGYKAQRKGMPEELAVQLPVLKELLSAMGYKIVTAEGWEADDILGTFAESCKKSGNQCIIATGDRDTLQLVGGGVTVRLLSTKGGRPEATIYDEKRVFEDYFVTPKQLIDIKAIQGDSSDNIPGVAGIGQKGATELITRFGSLQYIYDNLDELDIKAGMKNKLVASKDMAFLSYMLGTVRTDAPIDTDINSYIPAPMDAQSVSKLMIKLEFFSMLEKMNLSAVPEAQNQAEEEPGVTEVSFINDTDSFLKTLQDKKEAVFTCKYKDNLPHSMAFCIDGNVFTIENDTEFFKKFLSDGTILKKTHNIKELFSAALCMDIDLCGARFDTMLAAYLLNPSANDYSLERLFKEYGIESAETISLFDEPHILFAPSLQKLCDKMEREITAKGLDELLYDIEMPLAGILADMERVGVKVDKKGIEDFNSTITQRINSLEKEIYVEAGATFNINSPKQLGEVLFERLQLPSGKKTKTGYSTSAEVLEKLRGVSPVVDHVLEYRSLSKLKSTYCEGLLKVIAKDGRIHSCFNQTETRTGRISSTEPNLQNIPVRTDLGSEMRKFFVAEDGCLLCDSDYSQIELRVLAHISGDTAMTAAFINNEDIHTATASQVFNTPMEEVTSQMRSRAKAVNFGIVYGIGAFSLAKDIGVSNAEASRYIKSYFNHYSGIQKYMENTVSEAKEKGYAETMFKRRRYLPELGSSNHNMRAFGERVARNMPIQGTAADIIKIAMIRVYNRLKAEGLSSKLILQVHDELIVEAPENEKELASKILSEEMERATEMRVPLIAEVKCGKTWYETK